MARFYGTVKGGRGEASRLGHSSTGLRVSAQSYSGDVAVLMFVSSTGIDCVDISVHHHDGGAGITLYRGPVADLQPRAGVEVRPVKIVTRIPVTDEAAHV